LFDKEKDMTANWLIFQSEVTAPHDGIKRLPDPPPWREMKGIPVDLPLEAEPDPHYIVDQETAQLVNAAIYLRRPLLVTGKPGTGKSSLARAIAYQLQLGKVLIWSITSRSNLKDGLYTYDAIGRLQDANMPGDETPQLGKYFRLGPLGTALLPSKNPRVLLIDELDKSDIDLPNDLLHVFEEGWFEIPELVRVAKPHPDVDVRIYGSESEIKIWGGRIECRAFPIVIMTSNGEREFPAPFLRRCIRLDLKEPDKETLARIVRSHFDLHELNQAQLDLLERFMEKRKQKSLATDQLLNAIFMVKNEIHDPEIQDNLLRALSTND